MYDETLSGMKGEYASQVFEKLKEEAFCIEGIYATTTIDNLKLSISLIENNIDADTYR